MPLLPCHLRCRHLRYAAFMPRRHVTPRRTPDDTLMPLMPAHARWRKAACLLRHDADTPAAAMLMPLLPPC